MESFGPTNEQETRLKRLQFPALIKIVQLLALDEADYGQYQPPAGWVMSFKNQTLSAEIGSGEIELALLLVVQPALMDRILKVLEIDELVGSNGKDEEWFSRVRARVRSQGLSSLQIKAAREAALGEASAGQPPPPPAWKEVEGGHLEKIMEKQSTLLPIAFLEKALLRSKAVAKLEFVVDGNKGVGTGFVVAGNWLVTNAHVFRDAVVAKTGKALFNYQKSVEGFDTPPITVALDPAKGFAVSPDTEYDIAIVALAEEPQGRWAELALKEKTVKVDDPVCIIQHPAGDQKHIGMNHNTVTYVDNNLLQYLTDTLPGSSGSPVFDRDWDLVGVHHAGGWLREPATKRTLFRNEGIVVAHLMKMVADLVQKMKD